MDKKNRSSAQYEGGGSSPRTGVQKQSLPISEIFASIQGEGVNAGRPSIFIRLGTCNLTCSWCDTWYTWDVHHVSEAARALGEGWKGPDWRMMPVREIVREVKKLGARGHYDHLVITGGEPLVQPMGKLRALIDMLPREATIEFETNGTRRPSRALDEVTDYYDVSPKLRSSNQQQDQDRIVREAIEWFAASPKAMFKFVIVDGADVEEMKRDYLKPFGIPAGKVMLMPEGIDEKTLNERGRWVAEVCGKMGYRFGPRLHIHLYGNRRGT